MKKVVIFLLVVFSAATLKAQPLPIKLKHTVIIDTDGTIDDMRAVSLLLARPEITIKAILLSDGSLPPVEGAEKVGSLLHEFNYESIPVAVGEVLKGINPPWRQFNRQVRWGSKTGSSVTNLNAVDYLSEELSNTNEKIIVICLGPLTNIGQLIMKNITLLSKI